MVQYGLVRGLLIDVRMKKPILLCAALLLTHACGRAPHDDAIDMLDDIDGSDATAQNAGERIQSLLSKLCIGGEPRAGAVVAQFACASADSATLVVVPYSVDGATWNQLRVKDTNLCVELPGATQALRAKADLGTCSRRPTTRAQHQLFRLDGNASSMHLIAKHSGLCLNVDESSLEPGAAIQQWTCGTYGNQMFARYTETTTPPVDDPVNNPPPVTGEVVTATFSGTSDTLPNPERGFYCFGESLDGATNNGLRSCYDRGYRLVFAPTRLDAFRNSDISQAYLDKLTAGFAKYRAEGVKAVLRFAYNYDSSGSDANLAQVQRHLSQLAPVLAANADVIGYVQAGFIGAWAEWHDSASGLTSTSNKDAIRNALMSAVPTAHTVSFRYPTDIMRWSASAVTDANAFNGSPVSRTGFHNDCFLSSSNDVGTYSDNTSTRDNQRNTMAAQTAFAPFGGETCGGFGPNRSTCADIQREGQQFHMTYLNADYYAPFRQQWKNEGCDNVVERTMGYRFELARVAHPSTVGAGGTLQVDVDVKNVGWSRIFSPRPLKVVLVSGGTTIVGESSVDLRMLAPTAQAASRISVLVNVPAGATRGSYAVYLAAPDIYDRNASDARFAVRFANADDSGKGIAWSTSTGRLSTGTSVTVQ